MSPATLIVATGVFYAALAVFHLAFWRVFRWDTELTRLGSVNRGIMQVLNLCLTYLFAVAAVGFIAWPAALAASAVGRFLLAALTVFWLLRVLYQPWFFGLGHRFSKWLFMIFIVGLLLHAAAWWTSNAAQV
jgi:hypothetical protein